MTKSKQTGLRLNPHSLIELKQHIDGIKFRSVSHAIDCILLEWLEARRETDKGKQTTIFSIKPPKKMKGKKKDATKD